MINTATKKPVTIEFVTYDGTNHQEVIYFTNGLAKYATSVGSSSDGYGGKQSYSKLTIITLEGEMLVSEGDKVIRGIKGEFYPCKPDIFAGSYNIGNGMQLPSAHQIGDTVFINFWDVELIGEVTGVHFYPGKVKYDFAIQGPNEGETRIYNIDSAFVSSNKKQTNDK